MVAELVGMSFAWEPFKAYYIPVSSSEHFGAGIPLKEALDAVKPVLENENIQKYGQNLK